MSVRDQIFFDIETIATSRSDYRSRIAAKIKPPGNIKKAESIAKWESEEKAGAIDEAIEKTVFNGGLCSVVQIQWAVGDGDIVVAQGSDEQSVFNRFFSAIDALRYPCVFAGHFITGFDLRIIKQRAIILGIRIPTVLQKAIESKPWDGLVFDTMIEWAGVRDSVSMDDLCYYLGVESPKSEMTGKEFGDFWRAGMLEECRKYGESEIVALREVFNKMTRLI